MDKQNRWYESVIRCVRITNEGLKQIAIHFIGWTIKWDEWIYTDVKDGRKLFATMIGPRVVKRNTFTFGPRWLKPVRNWAGTIKTDDKDIYSYELSRIKRCGFLNPQLNLHALKAACGDVTYAITLLQNHHMDSGNYY